jgi:hypothetical protein
MHRWLTSATLAAAVALVLGACTTGAGADEAAPVAAAASETPTTPAQMTTASLLAASMTAVTKAGSYAVTYKETVGGTTLTGSGRLVGTSISAMAIAMTVDTGTAGTLSMLVVGGRVYMDGAIAGAAGKWIDLTDAATASFAGLADQISSSADPYSMLSKLADDAVQVVRGGTSTIDGAEVTDYAMTVDVTEIVKATGLQLTQAQLDQLTAAGYTGTMGIDYYVGKDDLPVKVTVTMGDLLTEEMSYSGFGTQAAITPPAPGTVIPASQLGL